MQFNPSRLKLQLKLAVNRLKLLQQKKAALNATQRREIATLLEIGKEESARVRVEPIIREDFIMEAFELLELFCELLLARFGLIETMPMCDSVIKEAVTSLIYASPRCDLKELHQVRELLSLKYGKDFTTSAISNHEGIVNEKIVQKLKVDTPSPKLVSQYLIEIAKAYQVDWTCEIPQPDIPISEKITQATSSSDLPDIARPLEASPPYSGFSIPSPTAPLLPMEIYRSSSSENELNHSQPLSLGNATLISTTDSELKGSCKPKNETGEKWATSELEELSRRFDALKKR